MKMFMILGALLSSQILHGATLDCAISSETTESITHVKSHLDDGTTNLQLGSVFGYQVVASALELGHQSVIVATKNDLSISSASAGEVVNLRLENSTDIKEYFSNEVRISEKAMGFNIDFYNLGNQSTIVATKGSLRISSASAGQNVSNLRLETERGVYEAMCTVTK